jgi:hypothetical protein
MANELQTSFLPNQSVYFLVRNQAGQIWSTTGTPSFVTYATADYLFYVLTATEQGTDSGYYTADMPATIPAGVYNVLAKFDATMIGQLETDLTVGAGQVEWNGSAVIPLSNFAISGVPVNLLSGRSVLVYSGQLSGFQVNVHSGTLWPASGATQIASGSFVVAGLHSGSLSGQFVNVFSGSLVLPSGGNVGLLSGQFVNVYSGQLSGRPVNPLSGQTWLAPNSLSGQSVNPHSGVFVTASLNSGQSVLVYSGQLSGQPVNPLSGQTWIAPGSISGQSVNPHSGAFVTASLNSGQSTLVYSGQLSGQNVNVHSGTLFPSSGATQIASGPFVVGSVLSGQSVNVYSGQLSGFQVTARTITDKSGYVLGNQGLDFVWPESGLAANNASGVNARQMLGVIGATTVGQCSGNRTGMMEFDAVAGSGTTRVTATINSSGNRSVVVVNLG